MCSKQSQSAVYFWDAVAEARRLNRRKLEQNTAAMIRDRDSRTWPTQPSKQQEAEKVAFLRRVEAFIAVRDGTVRQPPLWYTRHRESERAARRQGPNGHMPWVELSTPLPSVTLGKHRRHSLKGVQA